MQHDAVDLPLDDGDLPGPELERLVLAVEQGLLALGNSLRERDAAAIEQQASALHRALADAVQACVQAARLGKLPDPLRKRLSKASAQLARQRETLSRATAALDRAIDVLMPGAPPGGPLYQANGLPQPLHQPGRLSA